MSQESAQSTAATEPVSTTGEAPEPVPTAAAEEPAATAPESATPESSTQEPTQTSPEALLARLTAATTEAEGLRDQLLRSRAEIENLRRRHTNELEKAHKFALDGFVRELLQVRDSLELGRAAALEATADVAKLREGTELTLKLLGDVMERFGVAVVDPLAQPFDPTYHQAISTQPRADVPPNTVVTVVQKGYTLNGRLVRPALVLVSQQGS